MRLLSVVLSFFSLFSREPNHNDPVEIAGEILQQTEVFAHKRYPLHACGTIMMMPSGNVKEIGLCFQAKTFLTRDHLRILLLECGEKLIQQINSNQPFQKFLNKRPFTMKEARIIIYNIDKNGDEPLDPLITNAEISGGVLTYLTQDPTKKWTYKNEFQESYEEALEIIKQNQMKNMPLNNVKK